ncbi:MAG: glycosyltransferase [Gemmataceae bacterium]
MRITHLIASMDPAQGGPPVVVANLAEAQAALGHQVTVAAEVFHPLPVATEESAVSRRRFHQLPTHRLLDLFRGARKELAGILQFGDVLHLHGLWEPVIYCAGREAYRRGIPYLIAPHGMLDPWSLSQKPVKKKLALALGFRTMLNRAAGLHVLNDDESRLLEPLGLTAPRVVIPNGIALDELRKPPDQAKFRAHPKGPADSAYVLFLSRLHYKKGLDFLADAFARLAPRHPELLLVVVGPDGGAEEQFRQQMTKLNLIDRLRMPGPLFGPDKWSAIAGASVFCLPSRQEGFSMAILEAMACRVPVVISDACHFPEVGQAGAGHVVPLDVGAIAHALESVLGDPATAAAMGRAGRQLVESRFTWPQIAAHSVQVYEQLAAGRSVR